MTTIRKITKFQTCERHAWLGKGGRRMAECFCEGGPGGQAGCRNGICRMWAGTDFFIPEVCTGEYPLDWTTNERISQ